MIKISIGCLMLNAINCLKRRERGIKGRQKEEREEMNKINILVWLVGWCIPFFLLYGSNTHRHTFLSFAEFIVI